MRLGGAARGGSDAASGFLGVACGIRCVLAWGCSSGGAEG